MRQWLKRLQQWDAQISAQIALSPARQQERGWPYWLALVGAHLGDSLLWAVVALWELERIHKPFGKVSTSQKISNHVAAATVANDPPRSPLIRRWLFALLISYLTNTLLKQTVKRTRPGTGEWLYGRGPDGYSFPSGHAMRMGVIATWAQTLWPRWAWLLWPLTLWVCWSRVRLGVHYVGDVVVGLGLGRLIGRALRK